MSQILTYTRPNNLGLLHDELLADGITPEAIEGDGNTITITVADAVSPVAVDTIVAAHDPNIMSLAEEADEETEESIADLRDGYTDTRARLTEIVEDVEASTDPELRVAVRDLAAALKVVHRFAQNIERL